MQQIAVIGAGPGGFVAARYLKSEGVEPVVFEQGARIGGQWSADPGHSGVWPGTRTNTSRITTCFSEPELHRWPELARELMFGPLPPASFRMSGRDNLPDAPKRFATEAQAFGCIKSGKFAPEQIAQLQALGRARGDEVFSRYVTNVCSRGDAASAN